MIKQGLLILIVFLAACASTEVKQTAKPNIKSYALTDAEVMVLISGKTMYATSSRGDKYQLYFAKDGSLTSSNGGTGKWQVKNGSICNTYVARGFRGCDKVYRKENNQIFYVVENGKKGTIHKTVTGNKL